MSQSSVTRLLTLIPFCHPSHPFSFLPLGLNPGRREDAGRDARNGREKEEKMEEEGMEGGRKEGRKGGRMKGRQ